MTEAESVNDFHTRGRYCALSESRGIPDFLGRLVRGTRAFRLWEQWCKYFRRFRFIAAAFRAFPWILLAISTNTLLYAMAAVVLLLIPPLLVGLVAAVGFAPLQYKRCNAKMTTALGGKTVYVLFPFGERELARDSFFRTNVRELAARPRSAVVVVSPFWIRAKGLSEGGFYAHLRREDVAIYLVRRHYFFSLRKNVLTRCDGRVILIY